MHSNLAIRIEAAPKALHGETWNRLRVTCNGFWLWAQSDQLDGYEPHWAAAVMLCSGMHRQHSDTDERFEVGRSTAARDFLRSLCNGQLSPCARRRATQ
jgi:hypothetical protein